MAPWDWWTVCWGLTVLMVSGKALGSKRPLFADWGVPLPERRARTSHGDGNNDDGGAGDGDGDGGFTLRDLISHVVAFEVAAFTHRQGERRRERGLSAGQIEQGEAAGKVAPEGRELKAEADEESAIAAALQAFEDGMYLVVVDGEEHRDLDAQVFCGPDSRVTFVRLVFLAGA